MNFNEHITHYGGKSLKSMNREDLIEALQREHYAHNQTIREMRRLQQKSGKSDFFVS